MRSLRSPKVFGVSDRNAVHHPRDPHLSSSNSPNKWIIRAAEVDDPTALVKSNSSSCPFLRSVQDVPEHKHSLWGELELFFTDPYKYQTKVMQGRPVVTAVLMGAPHVISGTPATTKQVLGHGDAFVMESEPAKSMLGREGLLFLNGEKHEFVRGVLAPLFAPDEIEKYTPKVQQSIGKQLSQLAEASKRGKPATAHLYMRQATFDIICKVVIGLDVSDEELQDLFKDFDKLGTGIMYKAMNLPFLELPFLPGGQAVAARNRLFKRLAEVLDTAYESISKGESVQGKGVFQEIVAVASRKLTREQLLDNMVFFLNGGFDTTSSFLTHLMYNAYKYPQHRRAVVHEQELITAQHGQQITAQVLRDMSAAERFVRETLRLRHPVAQMTRTAVRDVQVGDLSVPEGTNFLVPIQMHAIDDPTWAGMQGDLHPTLFNPDRYLKSGSWGQSMVFGIGKHSCLGQPLAVMEAKVLVAMLARGYDVQVTEEPTSYTYVPIITPKNWLPVVLTQKV